MGVETLKLTVYPSRQANNVTDQSAQIRGIGRVFPWALTVCSNVPWELTVSLFVESTRVFLEDILQDILHRRPSLPNLS